MVVVSGSRTNTILNCCCGVFLKGEKNKAVARLVVSKLFEASNEVSELSVNSARMHRAAEVSAKLTKKMMNICRFGVGRFHRLEVSENN